ncbi:sunset domain-containing protein [Nigerium massiliense]|uniref:sunset domain-containing protein n=1 Tax=Nigerium massiliense TaxID=1522317 RepID=UPI0011C9D6D1|nr:hypothetical protein [Nigerium massiliense]
MWAVLAIVVILIVVIVVLRRGRSANQVDAADRRETNRDAATSPVAQRERDEQQTIERREDVAQATDAGSADAAETAGRPRRAIDDTDPDVRSDADLGGDRRTGSSAWRDTSTDEARQSTEQTPDGESAERRTVSGLSDAGAETDVRDDEFDNDVTDATLEEGGHSPRLRRAEKDTSEADEELRRAEYDPTLSDELRRRPEDVADESDEAGRRDEFAGESPNTDDPFARSDDDSWRHADATQAEVGDTAPVDVHGKGVADERAAQEDAAQRHGFVAGAGAGAGTIGQRADLGHDQGDLGHEQAAPGTEVAPEETVRPDFEQGDVTEQSYDALANEEDHVPLEAAKADRESGGHTDEQRAEATQAEDDLSPAGAAPVGAALGQQDQPQAAEDADPSDDVPTEQGPAHVATPEFVTEDGVGGDPLHDDDGDDEFEQHGETASLGSGQQEPAVIEATAEGETANLEAAPTSDFDAAVPSSGPSVEPQDEEPLAAGWDGPFGPGSADAGPDGSGPEGWTVKGAKTTKVYLTPDIPVYDQAKANVWFIDEARAQDAGFRRWDLPKN